MSAPHHLIQHIVRKSFGVEPLPQHWYQERRQAEKRLLALSQGRLVLLSRVYSGDDERHQIVHEVCGRPFRASMNEIVGIGPNRICPYCNITDDLRRFGSLEQVQHYVIEASGSAVYFYTSNDLSGPDETYTFLCMLHRKAFRSTFTAFQEGRGETNGCPFCEADARLRASSD